MNDWVEAINARGLGSAFRTVLDVLTPLGPLAAQLLYVAQPVTGLFGWGDAVANFAHTLEDPEEIAALRQRLKAADDD